MKRIAKAALVLMLLGVVTLPVQAKTDLTFSGQIRNQTLMEKRAFDKDAEFTSYDLLRTRFNIMAEVDNNVTVFVQAQDSRTLGIGGFSGTLNSAQNVDLHQAYFSVSNVLGKGWGAMGGRFEFVKGNHRIFGNVGWSNVGRAWEGGTFWYTSPKYTITAFGFKKVERDPIGVFLNVNDDEDFDVMGLYGELADLNLDLFVIVDEDARDVWAINSDQTDSTVEKAMTRATMGMYYHRLHNKFDFEMNAAIQLGNYVDYNQDFSGFQYDYGGILVAFEAGYSLADARNTRVALGIDYTSGDKTVDSKDKTFYNLYWTGHKFNGYMDYFTEGGPNGLVDLMFRARTDITTGWVIALDLHMFTAAQDYEWTYVDEQSQNVSKLSKDIGSEIDLTIKTSRVAGIGLQWGASYFMAKDQFAETTDKDPGAWSYFMATVDF